MKLLTEVYAQNGISTNLVNPFTNRFGTLQEIFNFVINVIIGVGWALVFIMLALGFIQYVTSQGEAKATDKARMWLTYAVIGGVGLFFITALKAIIPGLLGGNLNTGNIF